MTQRIMKKLNTYLQKYTYILVLLLMFSVCTAASPIWLIVPSESTLTVIGTQNDAPLKAVFEKFTGDIHFDTKALNKSSVKIVIDIASIHTAFPPIAETLKREDWFDVKQFPQATFTAQRFVKTKNNTYQAVGTLTIRDKTHPASFLFTTELLSNAKLRVTGHTTLHRTAFGVGQGEWASTKEVKDNVEVNFTLTLQKPA